MIREIVSAAAVVISLAGASSAATTIFQDDFNANTPSLSSTPAGWNLDYGDVDVYGPGVTNRYPGNGSYIDLDGSINQAGRISTVEQFETVAGQTYTLTFDYGKNWGNNSLTAETLSFGFGGWSDVIEIGAASIPSLIAASFTFQATTTGLSSLFFAAAGGDNRGPIIDNVALSTELTLAAVPVPAAGFLMLGAVGALAGLRRRRRQAAA